MFEDIKERVYRANMALAENKLITLTWTPEVESFLVGKSYSVKYGARNLRRLIQKDLEDPIATRIIDSYQHPITQIKATAEGDTVSLLAL